MQKARRQMSESMILAVLLTLAGGFQDAYSYNCRGHVFANAQTGNIVLLGQNAAMGSWGSCLRYLFPLLAFMGGVFLAELVRYRYTRLHRLHWRQIVLALEILLLAAAGLMPPSLDTLSNVLLSFACAMQVNSFPKFRGYPCATTMCIGNMRSGTQSLSQYLLNRDPQLLRRCLHYYELIAIFAVGAAIGAVCSIRVGALSIWIPAGLLLIGLLIMFIQEEASPQA